jgi:hypothetical protein
MHGILSIDLFVKHFLYNRDCSTSLFIN